jgi:hypothetical protein
LVNLPPAKATAMLVRRFLFRAVLAVCALTALAASPARAQEVVLRDLVYDLGFMKISAPRIEVRGTSLSERELREILDPASPAPAVERLQRLNAASATIPELVMDREIDGNRQRTVYRNTRLDSIRAGVIGAMRIEGISGDYQDKTLGSMPFRIGETVAEAIDLPLNARVLTTAAADPRSVPMAPLYRSLVYRDYVMELPGKVGDIRIARMASRDFRARPGKEPMLATLRAMMELAEKQARTADKNDSGAQTPGADDLALIARTFALLDSFETGVADIEGFSGRFTGGETPATFSIAAMRFSDQAQQPGLAMRDLKVEAGPARMALAEFEARDFSFRETFRAAADMLAKGDVSTLATDYMKLIPRLGTIRMSGFDLQAPDPNAQPRRRQNNQPQQQPELIRAAFKSFEIGVANQLNGIPTAFRFGAEEMKLPLSPNSRDQSVRDLIAAGVREVNLSWLADLAWRQDANAVDIKALRVSGKDLLSANITGRLGNVTKDAFAPDLTLAQMSWLSATAQRLSIAVEDFGGFGKLIENEARKARKQPDALRREWGTIAAVAIPALLGDSDGVKALSGAVSRFIARPGQLAIDLRARNEAGIGLADGVMAMGDPRSLVNKVEIRAEAR